MTNRRAQAHLALSALSDPTRRIVFERIAARPSAVVELAKGLTVSRSAVSQHLGVLKEAQLVIDAAEGTRRIYRIDPKGVAVMRDWLDGCWTAALKSFKAFADHEENEG